ncbi:MAG: hypothetical protein QME35_05380 [Thermoanaerobacteraceae bacterium]|nr:hypothetical protein [Thermoanaerobacteraceae bacterium]
MDNAIEEKAIEMIKKLPKDKLAEVIDFIEFINQKNRREREEDKAWLDSNLKDWPDFDWGPDGPPNGRPVKYVKGIGLIIEGGRPDVK